MLTSVLVTSAVIGVAALAIIEELPYWHHKRNLKRRSPITATELQEKYLQDVPLEVVEKLLRIVQEQFGENPMLVRPDDNHCWVYSDLDSESYINAIKETFGFTFTPPALENSVGTFGETARYVAKQRTSINLVSFTAAAR